MITGFDSIVENMENSVSTLKMKAGESKVIRLIALEKAIALWEHVEQFGGQWKTIACLGKEKCPICKSGKNASHKTYLPMVDRTDDKVKTFKANKTCVKQLSGLKEEYGDLTTRDIKVTRHGSGLDTTYQFFARDAKEEDLSAYEEQVPDFTSFVEQLSVEEIEQLMAGNVPDGVPVGADEDLPF